MMATQPSSDARKQSRFCFKLAAGVFFDGQEFCGFIKDISLEGATLYIDHHFQKPKSILLHIRVPPLIAASKPYVVKVAGTVVYSIYDCDEMSFRSGVKLNQFNTPSDRDLLQEHLSRT